MRHLVSTADLRERDAEYAENSSDSANAAMKFTHAYRKALYGGNVVDVGRASGKIDDNPADGSAGNAAIGVGMTVAKIAIQEVPRYESRVYVAVVR